MRAVDPFYNINEEIRYESKIKNHKNEISRIIINDDYDNYDNVNYYYVINSSSSSSSSLDRYHEQHQHRYNQHHHLIPYLILSVYV
jgi:hypothetical protein